MAFVTVLDFYHLPYEGKNCPVLRKILQEFHKKSLKLMEKSKNFFKSTCKASAIFPPQGKRWREKKNYKLDQNFIRLSLILITQLFKQAQGGHQQKKFQSLSLLFSSKNFVGLSSGEKLIAILKHLDPHFLKRDLKTISYDEILSRYRMSMKQVNFCPLSPYICPAKEITALSRAAQKSPGLSKTRFFMPIRQGRKGKQLSEENLQKELQREQERCRLWKQHSDGNSSRVSPV